MSNGSLFLQKLALDVSFFITREGYRIKCESNRTVFKRFFKEVYVSFCDIAPIELGAVKMIREETSLAALKSATLAGADELCVTRAGVNLVLIAGHAENVISGIAWVGDHPQDATAHRLRQTRINRMIEKCVFDEI